jgi:hypothetical protein
VLEHQLARQALAATQKDAKDRLSLKLGSLRP